MSLFRLIAFMLCCHASLAFAEVVTCNPTTTANPDYHASEWSEMHQPFELKPSGVTVTYGEKLADWAVLYTIDNVVIGNDVGYCYGTSGILDYFTMLSQIPPISLQGNDYVYATSVPGIGISVAESYSNRYNTMQPYPKAAYWGGSAIGIGFHATIRFWKIPGQNIPMGDGAVTVVGPEMAVVYEKSGATFTSSDPDRITSDGRAYINGSRILTATLLFQPGTCNIEGDNIRVNMGKYDGTGGHSDWKDASFKLLCPDGYGYNGSATVTGPHDDDDYPFSIVPNASDITFSKNSKKNGRVQISIVPYTEVVDANKGIIALDGTGAQGYGIQLAWGDYSSQSLVEPANPVILNSYVDANSLNSAFSAGDTPIGGNGFTGGDNTIKMAARYIRTTGDTAPGPANAVVQVIANYQ